MVTLQHFFQVLRVNKINTQIFYIVNICVFILTKSERYDIIGAIALQYGVKGGRYDLLYKKEDYNQLQKAYLLFKWGVIFTIIFSLDPYIYMNQRVFSSIGKVVILMGIWNSCLQSSYHFAKDREKILQGLGILEIVGDTVLIVLLARAQGYYQDGFMYMFLILLVVWTFVKYGLTMLTSILLLFIGLSGFYIYQVVSTVQYTLKNQKFMLTTLCFFALIMLMYGIAKENTRLKMLLEMKEKHVDRLKKDVVTLNDLHKVSSRMDESNEIETIATNLIHNSYKLIKLPGIQLICYGENDVESDARIYFYTDNKNKIGTKHFYEQKQLQKLRNQRDYKNCILSFEPVQIQAHNENIFKEIFPYLKEKYVYFFPVLKEKKEYGMLLCNTCTPLSQTVCNQISLLVKYTGNAFSRTALLEKARNIAIHDKLTGAKTRGYLDETMEVLESKSRRKQIPVSVIFCDIDRFKKFNDRYGHHIGDCVLKEVVKAMKKHESEHNMVARYGGEEFVMLMYGANEQLAYETAEVIRRDIAHCQLDQYVGEPCSVTISIGVATYPQDQGTLSKVVECADWAMYQAKKSNNKVCCYRIEWEEKNEDKNT